MADTNLIVSFSLTIVLYSQCAQKVIIHVTFLLLRREDILDEKVIYESPSSLPQGNSLNNMKKSKSLHLTTKSKPTEITSPSDLVSLAVRKRHRFSTPVRSKRCSPSHQVSESATKKRYHYSSDDVFEFHSRSPSPVVITRKKNILPTRFDNLVTPPNDSTTDRPKVISRYSIIKKNKTGHSTVICKVLPQAQGLLSHQDCQEESTVSLVDLYKRRCRSCTLCIKPNCGQCYTCITNKNASLKDSLVCLRKVR
jgi:hypothetical protein